MEELKKQLVLYIEPDPMLRRKAERVGEVTPGILAALDGMAEIIGRFDGIGLAGPQVGVLKRIILIDAGTIAAEDGRPMPAERYMRLIDPEIIGYSKETCEREEGCLSLPTIFANVTRPEGIDFEYTDAKGKRIRAKAD
ncbi:MAG: peptide deformylase, partial [Rickettsiales bacterium]|nr:peptide deformylase [Rickettsiales bacterium]